MMPQLPHPQSLYGCICDVVVAEYQVWQSLSGSSKTSRSKAPLIIIPTRSGTRIQLQSQLVSRFWSNEIAATKTEKGWRAK